MFVTPNVLTEASNLLANTKDLRFLERLRSLIQESEEVVVNSKVAALNCKFPQIGLTDAALLEVISADRPLLTTDYELYGIASAKEAEAAFNFLHYRNW